MSKPGLLHVIIGTDKLHVLNPVNDQHESSDNFSNIVHIHVHYTVHVHPDEPKRGYGI